MRDVRMFPLPARPELLNGFAIGLPEQRFLSEVCRQHKNHRQGHYASCSPAKNPVSPAYGQFTHDTFRLPDAHHDDHDRH